MNLPKGVKPLSLSLPLSTTKTNNHFLDNHLKMQRSCDCIPSTLQLASPILTQKSVPFDLLLDISHKITLQWSTVVHCEQCATDEHTTSTLTQIAARLLTFYEAAFTSYSMTRADDPSPPTQPQSQRHTARRTHPRPSTSPTRTPQPSTPTSTTPLATCHCIPSRMTLGELTLDAPEARVLAEQLLADCLLHLDSALADLRGMVEDLLREDLQWQANSRLAACDALIVQTMNRLAKLVGQLRFDAGPRK